MIKVIGNKQREVRSEEHRMTILVSYTNPVAIQYDGGNTVVVDTRYSKTTTQHINKWMQGRFPPTPISQTDLDGILAEVIGRSRLDPM